MQSICSSSADLSWELTFRRSVRQKSWQLDPGDELLMATDGFYDQPTHKGRLAENLAALDAHHHESSLLNAAHAVLNEVWAEHPQFDDTTLVGACFKRVL